MKFSKILILISAISMFGASLANADYKSFGNFGYSHDIQIERTHQVPDLASTTFRVVHSCRTEGYQCASGTSCELKMSRGYRSKYGTPLNAGSSNTLHFYSCNGSTSAPQCSVGFTALKDGDSYRCVYFR